MNSSDHLLMKPLSIEEICKLESFLISERSPEECLSSIEMLDAYMTALAVGPDLIEPDVWIPFIWNQADSEEPTYTSEDEAGIIMDYLVRHMNTIARQFHNDPEGFLPLFDSLSYQSEEEKEAAAEDWALGFIMGMELTYTAWEPLLTNEENTPLVLPMFILSKVSDGGESITKKEQLDLIRTVAPSVISIYYFWKKG